MAAPETLLIRHEAIEDGRFTHVGTFGSGNQFLGYVTFAYPKYESIEGVTPEGQESWQERVNCFVVLHRFDANGVHLGSTIERVAGTAESNELDWTRLDDLVIELGDARLGDIRVRPFQVESDGVLHGLIYEYVDDQEGDPPGVTNEWVMLEPNDIMFHPPWDSGEYST